MLTDAELDHVLGLLMLRQAAALTVVATATVRSLLECSGIVRLLGGYLQVTWRGIVAGPDVPLDPACPSGLTVRAVAVGAGNGPPTLALSLQADATVALRVSDPSGGVSCTRRVSQR